MNFHRERLAKLIREELSKIIARDLEFQGALVTVTDVEFDKQLLRAVVKVSVWPMKKEAAALAVLANSVRELRSILFKRLSIRQMPGLVFELDHGNENAAKVEKLLLSDENNNLPRVADDE